MVFDILLCNTYTPESKISKHVPFFMIQVTEQVVCLVTPVLGSFNAI